MRLLGWLCLAVSLGEVAGAQSSTLAKRDTVGDILSDIKNLATCSACEVGFTRTGQTFHSSSREDDLTIDCSPSWGFSRPWLIWEMMLL